MIIELTEYEIKEAIISWLKEKGISVNIKYLPTDVIIRPNKGMGYSIEVESHREK